MSGSLILRIDKNRPSLVVFTPFSFAVIRRDDRLFPDEENVERAIGVFGFLDSKIESSADSADGAQHRWTCRFRERLLERSREFTLFHAITGCGTQCLFLSP